MTDNTQETIELDKPHYSKEKHDSKDCIPDTQPDLSGQKDTAVEVSGQYSRSTLYVILCAYIIELYWPS